MKIIITLLAFISISSAFSQEPYKNNQTYTYDQLHKEYAELVKSHPKSCKLIQFGTSDYGKNIELFLINKNGNFQEGSFKDKSVLMINNAIHPGEPCGVDACVKLSKELLADEANLPENVVIGIIPMYNVGGAHNRSCCSRANQNGPEEYGFRGNAQNLDLNRDFIKSDSKNTFTFYKIYHFLKPNIFIDTHTSDGADYQHVMTLITSQMDKMHPWMKSYAKAKLNPALFKQMDKVGYPMVPYVHQMKTIPDDGIKDYLETPRYSTGYTNLFNTISYVTETHMLKPFEERVESTYAFIKIMVDYMEAETEELIALKKKLDYRTGFMEEFVLNWEIDTLNYDTINFMGYEAEYINSDVTGLPRLHYNREKPWTRGIKYYNRYNGIDTVRAPEYYIIPQAWKSVIIRLQMNNVKIDRLVEDMVVETEVYYIDHYDTRDNPYEGHYLHTHIEVSKKTKQITYHKGDYVVHTNNENRRFLVETLEPHAPDSYFAWNYFDPILQQKEWFSAYVFEEKAMQILKDNPELKSEFEEKRKTDKDFAASGFAQLYFIYKRSSNYERTYNMYPITRFMVPFNSDEIEPAPILIGG